MPSIPNGTMCADTLFENPVIPVPRPPRLRREPTNLYKFIRRVKGGAWQARIWLGAHAGGSLNLGLFTIDAHPDGPDDHRGDMAAWAASEASKAFWRFFRTNEPGRGLRETMEHLKRRQLIPLDVLPPRIRLAEDGSGYVARVRKGGRCIAPKGVFACEWEAYRVMCSVLAREFPRSASRSEIRAAEREREAARLAELRRKQYGYTDLIELAAA